MRSVLFSSRCSSLARVSLSMVILGTVARPRAVHARQMFCDTYPASIAPITSAPLARSPNLVRSLTSTRLTGATATASWRPATAERKSLSLTFCSELPSGTYSHAPSLVHTYTRMSCALMAEGAVIFFVSGRLMPQAAHSSSERLASETALSLKSRTE